MPRSNGKKTGVFAGNLKDFHGKQIVLCKRPIAVMVLVHVQEEKGRRDVTESRGTM